MFATSNRNPRLRPVHRTGLALIALLLVLPAGAQTAHREVLKRMGSRFELTAVGATEAQCAAAVRAGFAEIERIERLISSWDPQSQTSAINRAAGRQPVRVDPELYDLIHRAKKVSALTEGAFDISYASMDRIWHFDGSMDALPDSATVRAARAHIDWQRIELNSDSSTVFLRDHGMKIGFGAIGKGYAANRARACMRALPGVTGGVVNAGGDLITWGTSTRPEGWTVHITDPKDPSATVGWLRVDDLAVVTSGDYERFVEFDGVRYAHIIDPRTGYPTTGIKSVTLVCPDAELADALATSVFVLGVERGLALVNRLRYVECLVVTDADELRPSEGMRLNRERLGGAR